MDKIRKMVPVSLIYIWCRYFKRYNSFPPLCKLKTFNFFIFLLLLCTFNRDVAASEAAESRHNGSLRSWVNEAVPKVLDHILPSFLPSTSFLHSAIRSYINHNHDYVDDHSRTSLTDSESKIRKRHGWQWQNSPVWQSSSSSSTPSSSMMSRFTSMPIITRPFATFDSNIAPSLNIFVRQDQARSTRRPMRMTRTRTKTKTKSRINSRTLRSIDQTLRNLTSADVPFPRKKLRTKKKRKTKVKQKPSNQNIPEVGQTETNKTRESRDNRNFETSLAIPKTKNIIISRQDLAEVETGRTFFILPALTAVFYLFPILMAQFVGMATIPGAAIFIIPVLLLPLGLTAAIFLI